MTSSIYALLLKNARICSLCVIWGRRGVNFSYLFPSPLCLEIRQKGGQLRVHLLVVVTIAIIMFFQVGQ